MLSDTTAIATIAVKDLDAASRFYEGTLGLSRLEAGSDPTTIMYQTGASALVVYQSSYAGTNQATYASWAVGDEIEGVVEDLKSKGVAFERYDDLPGTLEGDIYVMEDLKSAWFKDPDGNILNVVNVSM